MIEQACVFTRTGIILWNKKFCTIVGNPISELIQSIFIEGREYQTQYTNSKYSLKWSVENEFELIFVIVYQKILQLLYITDLIELFKRVFISTYKEEIKHPIENNFQFDDKFMILLKDVVFNSQSKKKISDITITGDRNENNDANIQKDNIIKPKKSLLTESSLPQKKPKKVLRSWDTGKVTQQEINKLDCSKDKPSPSGKNKKDSDRNIHIEIVNTNNGSDEEISFEEPSEIDIQQNKNDSKTTNIKLPEVQQQTQSLWTNNFLYRTFERLSGNKVIDEDDLKPVLENLRTNLLNKNVAQEVVDEILKSLTKALLGNKLGSFERITTTVNTTLESCLYNILTPGKSIDIIRSITLHKEQHQIYTICFVGVNGVGKSTTLSKIAYYLKQKNFNILVAACDTYRSGAVEQLKVHGNRLGIEIYDKGYAKDPAGVCNDAIQYAKKQNIDVVLIDTAGRMQNNEPLMRSLVKLISTNNPNIILFIGEALVGNDGIDQLMEFNKALSDYSTLPEPRLIDGIVLTKYDTIDTKVGAAISMVYKSRKPIVFLGTGQKYTNLRKMDPKEIVKALFE